MLLPLKHGDFLRPPEFLQEQKCYMITHLSWYVTSNLSTITTEYVSKSVSKLNIMASFSYKEPQKTLN